MSSSDKVEYEVTPEMLQTMLEKFQCNPFACEGAKCCTNVLLLSQKEINRIKQYIKTNGIEVKSPYSVFRQEYVDKCPFLDPKTLLCKIYPVRGQVCKSFTCNMYLKKKPAQPNYRDKFPVDMLATFGGSDIYYPCKPDLTEVEEKLKNQKRKAYGGK